MGAIDRDILLADIKFWLPSSNTIDDTGLTKLSEYVITEVGDDDTKYAEILCKSLKSSALKNESDSGVNTSSLKKFKYGSTEEEYFKGSKNIWSTWIDNIDKTCAQFGYIIETVDDTGTNNFIGGMYINPGDAMDLFEDYEGTDGYPS